MKKRLGIVLCIVLVLSLTLQVSAIRSVAVKGISLDKSKITLKVGETYKLKITLKPANTTQKLLTFITGDKKVATVDSKGLIKAVGKGSTTITAYTSNKKISAKCIVTVTQTVYTINWLPQCDGPVDESSPVVKELEKKFSVKLNFIYLDRSKEAELLNLRIASGDIPDVFKITTDDRYRQYIDQGVVAEIPESLMKAKAPKLYDMVLKNSDGMGWKWSKEGGKLYGIPSLSPDGQYNFVPIWRNDWLANVGINKTPTTLKEAEDAFYKFVNNDPDRNNRKDTYALSDKGFSTIFGAYGGIPYCSKGGGSSFTWTAKNGKVVATAVMPEMKEALTLLNKWYKDGLIDPEFISEENKGQYWGYSIPFWNGKIGFSTPGQYYHIALPLYDGDLGSAFYQNFKKLQAGGTYVEGKPLAGPSGKSGTESWGTYTGIYFVMGKNVTKVPGKMEKILEIDETVSSDFDTFVFARYGYKGVNYDVVNGNYAYIGTTAQGSDKSAKLGLGMSGICYASTNNFEFYHKVLPVTYNYANKVGKDTKYVNVVWGGLPSAAQYKATIEKKIKESYVLFISGERSLNEFDKFVDELNKAGLEQLTREANDWYAKNNNK
jgi:Bacterial surface proteins containing Ig-like domains